MPHRKQKRSQRLLVMLTDDELKIVDEWRFQMRMPSRAAAIRELIRLGLTVREGDIDVDNLDKVDFVPPSYEVEILPEDRRD